jgi:hypothetical protein
MMPVRNFGKEKRVVALKRGFSRTLFMWTFVIVFRVELTLTFVPDL